MATLRKKRRPVPKPKAVARRHPAAEKTDEEVYQDFLENSGSQQLGMKLRVLEAQSQAMGLVPGDRAWFACKKCGLFEGESNEGLLFTSRRRDSPEDTGLRFEKLTDSRWRCPGCCAKIVEPEYKPPPGFWDDLYKK